MKTVPQMLCSPLAILPSQAIAMLETWRREGLLTTSNESLPPTLDARADYSNVAATADRKPYCVVEGVAMIPVSGVLVHERSWWCYGETCYADILECMNCAMGDDDVRGVAMWVCSPGGVVSGCFDLCDKIYEMRGEKPIWAIVDEDCYSAAYAIASCADKIIVPRTGGVGSIGVITMHMDITGMLEQFGVKVTTIQFGARKSDSYPTTPLSKEAEKRMQADVDLMGEMFVDIVARNRGIKASVVRATEAGCYLGEAGKEIGLADEVMPVDQALLALMQTVNKEN